MKSSGRVTLAVGGTFEAKKRELCAVLEQSFLLLKPDALRMDRVDPIMGEIIAKGLEIVSTSDIRLTPEHVRALWMEYTPERHPLTFAFLDRYLCGGTSRVIFVQGPDAFEVARRIKRTIRSRFSRGVFGNVVHAAETRAELIRQTKLLATECGYDVLPTIAAHDADSLLRPSGLPAEEIWAGLEAIEEIWRELEATGGQLELPTPIKLSDGNQANWGVLFGVDSYNSVDSAVAAVKWTLPDLNLVNALRLAMYAGRADGHLIAIGDEAAVRECVRSLKTFGIRNCAATPLDREKTDSSRD